MEFESIQGLVVSVFDVSIPHLMSAFNQFSFIIIAVSRGTSYGENATNATTTSLSDFQARGRRTHELDQSLSTRSATRPEVHIQLEHGYNSSEQERGSRDGDLHLAKYSPAKAV
jgi:hypothetical protein